MVATFVALLALCCAAPIMQPQHDAAELPAKPERLLALPARVEGKEVAAGEGPISGP